jgi:hypothetical protein
MKLNRIIFTLILLITFNSCSNDTDSCTKSVWYEDSDNDGFGNPNSSQSSCRQPENYVTNSDDIDDSNANINPNNVWQGSMITFTKENNSDWTLEGNQDRITENVWITRQNIKGLFNIVVESSDAIGNACQGPEPSDTEWAYGSFEDISSLTFQNLGDLIGCNFQNIVNGENIILHLITDDVYINLKFISWSIGNGGGFSYERSTMN